MAPSSAPPVEPFAVVLREKIAELEGEEIEAPVLPDPLGDLLAATQRAVVQETGPLPRAGHAAYVQAPQQVAQPAPSKLDIRS